MTPPARGRVATVGSFDGLHRGHWAVLEALARRAAATGLESLLVTFEPHPLEVVSPGQAPQLLTVGIERRELLAQASIDAVAVVPFTPALASLAPEAFVRQVLLERFGMRELVAGYDHGFGRGRGGDVTLLGRLGITLGFGVEIVEPFVVAGQPVSSALIRGQVAAGDLEGAAHGLGRRYSAVGTVERGAGRGHRLGVATINLRLPDPRKLLPPDGVYAVWVEWARGRAGGMLNQGPRPTFGEDQRVLEAHLFEFDGDLYGELVKVEWVARLREVRRFESGEALARQLVDDAGAARRALTAMTPPE